MPVVGPWSDRFPGCDCSTSKNLKKYTHISYALGWPSHFVMELKIEVSRHYEIQLFKDLDFLWS